MSLLSTITCIFVATLSITLGSAQKPPYPPTFYNHSGCLYTHISDTSHYLVNLPENAEVQHGHLSKISYDSRTTCVSQDKPGLLVINFDIGDNFFSSMSIEMTLQNTVKNKAHYWEVTSAILNIKPNNASPYGDKTTFPLKPAGEIYADLYHSYSCSGLVLTHSSPGEPQFRITLKRFQIQPFPEPPTSVFAPSRDCSVWLTLPQIMGIILILFMFFTVLIGVYLLFELGNHAGEIKFSKQGGMLMNQAQLDATKAD